MLNIEWKRIEDAYGWKIIQSEPIKSGLINTTYKVLTTNGNYLLQQLNTHVFKAVDAIAHNIEQIGNYLTHTYPLYLFTHPIRTHEGKTLIHIDANVYRAFSYMDDSRTIQSTTTESEAYEAAYQFGLFTRKLHAFDTAKLHITIPQFHDLAFRYMQFEEAVRANNTLRKSTANGIIKELQQYAYIVQLFSDFIAHPESRIRVMHHDTKISNVLFDTAGKGLCVIDLDTIMPGYLFSDTGDMLRTYLAEQTEEEENIELISIRKPFLESVRSGYLKGIESEINSFEIDNFYLYGKIMMYMQALRFLTDYLQEDIYYGQKKEGHNLHRAFNQFRLLQVYEEATA